MSHSHPADPPSTAPRFVWHNHALHNADQTAWLENRALRYGDGLFETMRMAGGELLFFHDHIERMLHGAQALMLPAPAHWDARFFYDCVTRVLEANGHETSARIRIQLWRTGRGYYAPFHQGTDNAPGGVDMAIETGEATEAYVYNDAGLSAVIARGVKKVYDRLANIKTSSALLYVMAALDAQQQNADTAFVLNERGAIADAPGRNIFLLEQGRVVTPPLSDGGVAGVFRHQLLQLLRGHNIVTLEEPVTPESLDAADEIFVTNVIDGIQPVSRFNDRTFPTTQAKELYRLFRNHLQRDA